MRKIDFLLGMPLCWVGTQLKKITGRKTKTAAPRNILFIELSEMGSAILADPAMRKLQTSFDVQIHFVIFTKNRASLNLLDSVSADNIFVIREDSLGALILDTFRFLYWARRRKIDTVIDLELFSRFTALLAGYCGASRSVGFHAFYNEGLYRGDFLTDKVPYNPHIHIAKNFVALVNALLKRDEGEYFLKSIITDDEIVLKKVPISDCQKSAIKDKIRKESIWFDKQQHSIIIFNANAGEILPQRCWPAEYYAELARSILNKHESAYILFIGDAADCKNNATIVSQVGNSRCLNFAGKTTLHELLVLYSVSEFMLGNDSGPAHFAALTGMVNYTIFGPETPLLYAPLGSSVAIYAGMSCSPCVSASNHRKTSCKDNKCLQVLSPDYIYDLLRPSLIKLSYSGPPLCLDH